MADQSKCKHALCKCKVSPSQKDGFCTDSCRQSKMAGSKCGCGHPDCK